MERDDNLDSMESTQQPDNGDKHAEKPVVLGVNPRPNDLRHRPETETTLFREDESYESD